MSVVTMPYLYTIQILEKHVVAFIYLAVTGSKLKTVITNLNISHNFTEFEFNLWGKPKRISQSI